MTKTEIAVREIIFKMLLSYGIGNGSKPYDGYYQDQATSAIMKLFPEDRWFKHAQMLEKQCVSYGKQLARYREGLNGIYHAIRSEESITNKLGYHIERAYKIAQQALKETEE